MIRERSSTAQLLHGLGASSPFRALRRNCFPEQRAFIAEPGRFGTAHPGRRAGKSRGVGVWLLEPAAEYSGGVSVFFAKTAGTAKRILWQTLYELNAEGNLGLRFNSSDLTATAPNGYQIWLTGIKDKGEADKLRGGTHGFVRAAGDECASIRDETLSYAVLECAMPALGDHGGSLRLTGTPGPFKQGFFYERCKAWPNYHWDARANPFIPGEQSLADALEANAAFGWTWGHPTFRREYLGEWCEDASSIVYPFDAQRNVTFNTFGSGRTTLGVDVGWDDGNGFVVSRSRGPNSPEVHVLRAFEKGKLTLPQIAGEIEQLRREYHIGHIFIDTGGGGKVLAETLWRSYNIPCRGAAKGPKRPRIELVRGMLLAGTLKVDPLKCLDLTREWAMVPWDEDHNDHHERYSDECCDATLYSVLPHTVHYQHVLETAKPGTGAWQREQERIDKEQQERESAEVETETDARFF